MARLPTCWYQLPKVCRHNADILDHFRAWRTHPDDALNPHNLVPSCRACHNVLTERYDAVGRLAGNTRPGKPDPRNDLFHAAIDMVMASPEGRRVSTLIAQDITKKNRRNDSTTVGIY